MTETNKYIDMTYSSIEELLKRKDIMTNTLINRLNSEDNKFKIIDSNVIVTENRYILRFTLAANI